MLIATASGLFIAIPAFGFFYYLRNRAAGGLHVIEDTVNSLFRKMPYEMLRNVHIGDEENLCRRSELGRGARAAARVRPRMPRTSTRRTSKRKPFRTRPRPEDDPSTRTQRF